MELESVLGWPLAWHWELHLGRFRWELPSGSQLVQEWRDLEVLRETLNSNYAFKPTAEQALGSNRGASRRGGLTRR